MNDYFCKAHELSYGYISGEVSNGLHTTRYYFFWIHSDKNLPFWVQGTWTSHAAEGRQHVISKKHQLQLVHVEPQSFQFIVWIGLLYQGNVKTKVI